MRARACVRERADVEIKIITLIERWQYARHDTVTLPKSDISLLRPDALLDKKHANKEHATRDSSTAKTCRQNIAVLRARACQLLANSCFVTRVFSSIFINPVTIEGVRNVAQDRACTEEYGKRHR